MTPPHKNLWAEKLESRSPSKSARLTPVCRNTSLKCDEVDNGCSSLQDCMLLASRRGRAWNFDNGNSVGITSVQSVSDEVFEGISLEYDLSLWRRRRAHALEVCSPN